jgi:hypothetical protein
MGLIFKDDDKPIDAKAARSRAILFSLPFAIVGILALVFLLHDEIGSGFRMKKQMATGLLSAARRLRRTRRAYLWNQCEETGDASWRGEN